jgi:putative ABC transport system permease protein
MVTPRWKKVLGDLMSNPARTALVVMSIFVGVFSVGLITGTQAIVVREMNDVYRSANPATATISVSDTDGFSESMVETIRDMDEVGAAEARRRESLRVQGPLNDWRDIMLITVDDFEEIDIDQLFPLEGAWPPPDRSIVFEQSSLEELGVQVGDAMLIERIDGERRRQVQVAGVVSSPTSAPAQFGAITGFVTEETMDWLTGSSVGFNQLVIVSAENRDNIDHNREVAEQVYEKFQKAEFEPSFPNVSDGTHPLNTFISAMVAILSGMGVMSVFLSGFLVTNTIAALLAQQTRQIGIMKSIGARSTQIIVLYLTLVLGFGLIAFALAYPLASIGAIQFATTIGEFFNFNLVDTSVPTYVLMIELMISLAVPVVAAVYPVIAGTRVTVREALSMEGGAGGYGESIIDRMVQSVRGLPRPVLLSLRNTFRRKGRVTLTLLTLTLGGAIFIGIFSVRNSLLLTFEDILTSLFNYDVEVTFENDQREEYVVSEALRVPGVEEAETWRTAGVRRILPNGSEADSTITLWGVPPNSQMVQPTVIEGRWLMPEDQNAIVLSSGVFEEEEDLAVGDEIVVRLRGRDTTWRVVGKVVTIGGVSWAYTSYDSYGRAAREVGQAGNLYIRTSPRDAATQQRVAENLEEYFNRLGVAVVNTNTGASIREQQGVFVNVIIVVLLGMAVLIAVVGGLGLAGTMSLNVLERIREIGVMRAIGASDNKVLQVVMVEGIVLGILSWILGAAMSFPMSMFLSNQVGMQLFTFPLSFSFSPAGAIIWLVIAIALAAVASFLPAWRASRVTVREVLAYE